MKDNSITDPYYLLVQSEIDRINWKENKNKALYYIFRLIQIILAGIITVIASIKGHTYTFFDIEANVILGALITAITATETLFMFGMKKGAYTAVLNDLRAIRAEIIFLLYVSLPPEIKIEKARINPDDAKEIFIKYKKAYALIKTLNDALSTK